MSFSFFFFFLPQHYFVHIKKIGAEMTLDPPTPLQWKALQECVVEHHDRFANNNDDNDDNGLKSKTATIQAAPLIAIIDEASGSS